jgi:tetratricopeptide (TPR) repeat protein
MPPLIAVLLRLAVDLGPFEHRAAASLAIGDFEAAAAAWEDLAAAAPSSPRAPEALAEAALLRLALGQIDRADQDTARLPRGAARPDLFARVTFARVRHHMGAERWEIARALLAAAMPRLDRRASTEARVEAHALLASALAHLDRGEDATREYRQVLAIAAIARKLQRAWAEPARDAVAEGLFMLAEAKREAAERIGLAPYRGPYERRPILAYLHDKAEPWLLRRRYAIELAENAYERVAGVDRPPPPPPPPPGLLLEGDPNAPVTDWGRALDVNPIANSPPSVRFAIAAAARAGALWSRLRVEVRSLPLPLSPFPASGTTYFTTIDGSYDVLYFRAKRAYAAGLELAARHHVWTDDAAACEVWLTRNARAEYPPRDALWREEMRPSPLPPPTPIMASRAPSAAPR